MDLFLDFFFDLCGLHTTRAGRTLGNSKVGAAATSRADTEPTKAADLDIYNDHENDIDIGIDNENDDDDHVNVESLKKTKCKKKKIIQFSFRGCFSLMRVPVHGFPLSRNMLWVPGQKGAAHWFGTLLSILFQTCTSNPPREKEPWPQSYPEKHSPCERAPCNCIKRYTP